MKNSPDLRFRVHSDFGVLGSARASRAGDGVLAIANFSRIRSGFSRCRQIRNQHARRMRYSTNGSRPGSSI